MYTSILERACTLGSDRLDLLRRQLGGYGSARGVAPCLEYCGRDLIWSALFHGGDLRACLLRLSPDLLSEGSGNRSRHGSCDRSSKRDCCGCKV